MLELTGDRISKITYFLDTDLFEKFGLPPAPLTNGQRRSLRLSAALGGSVGLGQVAVQAVVVAQVLKADVAQ